MKKETAVKIIKERIEAYVFVKLKKRYTRSERRSVVTKAMTYAKEHLDNNPSHEQVDYVTDVIVKSIRKI